MCVWGMVLVGLTWELFHHGWAQGEGSRPVGLLPGLGPPEESSANWWLKIAQIYHLQFWGPKVWKQFWQPKPGDRQGHAPSAGPSQLLDLAFLGVWLLTLTAGSCSSHHILSVFCVCSTSAPTWEDVCDCIVAHTGCRTAPQLKSLNLSHLLNLFCFFLSHKETRVVRSEMWPSPAGPPAPLCLGYSGGG